MRFEPVKYSPVIPNHEEIRDNKDPFTIKSVLHVIKAWNQ